VIFLTSSQEFRLITGAPSTKALGVELVSTHKGVLADRIASIREMYDDERGVVILDVPEDIEERVCEHLLAGEEPTKKYQRGDPAGVYFAPEESRGRRTYRRLPRAIVPGDLAIQCGLAKRAYYMHIRVNNVKLDKAGNS